MSSLREGAGGEHAGPPRDPARGDQPGDEEGVKRLIKTELRLKRDKARVENYLVNKQRKVKVEIKKSKALRDVARLCRESCPFWSNFMSQITLFW